MRAAVAFYALSCLPVLALGMPACGQPEAPSTSPSVDAARRSARWAEYEADRRLTYGDYEGAFRAQARADSDRRAAERLEKFEGSGQARK